MATESLNYTNITITNEDNTQINVYKHAFVDDINMNTQIVNMLRNEYKISTITVSLMACDDEIYKAVVVDEMNDKSYCLYVKLSDN